jgi:photosystem I P700 chlorophyll a apoprotein A1
MGETGPFFTCFSKGPNNNFDLNLHADAHDFDAHTTDLEDISRKLHGAIPNQ